MLEFKKAIINGAEMYINKEGDYIEGFFRIIKKGNKWIIREKQTKMNKTEWVEVFSRCWSTTKKETIHWLNVELGA